MTDALSIEETNKIRKALGVPLLPVPGAGPVFKGVSSDSESDEETASTLESRQARAYDNFKDFEDERKAKLAREARKESIRKEQERAARNAKLQGRTLGEDDDQDQDTRSWLIGQKKRQKKIDKQRDRIRRLEEELKARENTSYTSKDLAGVRVAHELGDFGEDNDHVLVLKDATIEENDEEGDELENVDLREDERRNDRLELKKKKPVYNPNDLEDSPDGTILKQYDEVIEGKKRKRFTFDSNGQTSEQEPVGSVTLGEQTKRRLVSLDILNELPRSDYTEPKEIKIRKPKKQTTKPKRRKTQGDEDDFASSGVHDMNPANHDDAMEIDSEKASVQPSLGPASFIDDDDLQASLARQRRSALKNRKKLRPEDMARQLRDEEEHTMQEGEEGPDGGLLIDETSFFVSNIVERQREIDEERQTRAVDQHYERIKQEDRNVMNEEPSNEERQSLKEEKSEPTLGESVGAGIGDEANFNQGLGSVFDFLKGRGMWDAHEGSDANKKTRDSQLFRSQKRRLEAESEARAKQQRLAGRESGRYASLSQREREQMHSKENEMRQQQDSHKLARLYTENYEPNFELTYKDDFGREMTSKEAFKQLSHQFHGKGSGKMKTEKYLKKIEAEKKDQAKSLLDNSQMSNYSNAADAAAKRRGTVGVQLGK